MHEIKRIADMIEAGESNIGVLSCSEQIVAALLFNLYLGTIPRSLLRCEKMDYPEIPR